jgi:putative transposase
MMLAHKIALDPTDKQRSYFVRASGTARFAYNWALAEWKRQHAVGGKPSEVTHVSLRALRIRGGSGLQRSEKS